MFSFKARKDILSKATSTWKIKSSVIDSVAKKTDGKISRLHIKAIDRISNNNV